MPSRDSYKALVSDPTGKAEGMLKMSAKLVGLAVMLTATAILFVPSADSPKLPAGSAQSVMKSGDGAPAEKDEEPEPAAPLAAPALRDQDGRVPPKVAK